MVQNEKEGLLKYVKHNYILKRSFVGVNKHYSHAVSIECEIGGYTYMTDVMLIEPKYLRSTVGQQVGLIIRYLDESEYIVNEMMKLVKKDLYERRIN